MDDVSTPMGQAAAPLDAGIGLTREPDDDGWAVLRFDPQPLAMSGSAEAPYVHGGALATCVDTAGWEAVMVAAPGSWVATDLRVDFLRLVGAGPHRVRALARKVGRRQAVADVEIAAWDAPDRVLALGRAAYTRLD